jgi:hypothetical protein
MDGDYRQFFIDCMSKVKVYKYVDIAELSQWCHTNDTLIW